MRFDEIDLFGDFKINGATGTSGKVLGMTSGTIGWITVTSGGGGGGAGPQGYDGPALFNFTCGSVIAGGSNKLCESKFEIVKEHSNFNLMSYQNLSLGGKFSSIVSSRKTYINAEYSSIISSYNSYIYGGAANQNSSIISSYSSKISDGGNHNNQIIVSSYGVYLGYGEGNSIISSRNIPAGYVCDNFYSSIISSNNVCMAGSTRSTIISSCGSCLQSSQDSSIISSKNSCQNSSCNSLIIGSDGSRVNGSYNSVILGGQGNQIVGSTNSVILGGQDLVLESVQNTTLTQRMLGICKIKLCSLASEPNPKENGMMWYRNNKLWFQMNGSTGTVSLVT